MCVRIYEQADPEIYNTLEKLVLMRGERWSRSRAPGCQSRGRWFNPTYRRFET